MAQVEFTEAELLADVDVVEPLRAGEVRCHGGFDAAGRYVPPRTKIPRARHHLVGSAEL